MIADETPLVPPFVHLCEIGEPSPRSEPGYVPDDVDRIPVIYIAGAYSADDPWGVEKNVRRAEDACYDLEALGAATVCPHTNTRWQDRRTPYEQKVRATLATLRRCDAVFFLPAWAMSKGARGEHEEAIRRRMVLLFSLAEAEGYIRQRLGGKR